MTAVSAAATQDPGIVSRKKKRKHGLASLFRETKAEVVRLREEVLRQAPVIEPPKATPRRVSKRIRRDPDTGRIVGVIEEPIYGPPPGEAAATIKDVIRDEDGKVIGVEERIVIETPEESTDE